MKNFHKSTKFRLKIWNTNIIKRENVLIQEKKVYSKSNIILLMKYSIVTAWFIFDMKIFENKLLYILINCIAASNHYLINIW